MQCPACLLAGSPPFLFLSVRNLGGGKEAVCFSREWLVHAHKNDSDLVVDVLQLEKSSIALGLNLL